MVNDTLKIMKQMWESSEIKRKQWYFMIGAFFTAAIFYGLTLFIRFNMGFVIQNSDFLAGIIILIFIPLTFIFSMYYKKESEEIHNLYLEMIKNAK